MDKKAREQLVLDRFLESRPLFAGVQIARVVPAGDRTGEGEDPVPDFLCLNTAERRIGVELGEWLSPEQMAADIQQDRREEGYDDAIQRIPRPPHLGFMRIFPRRKLNATEAAAFSAELAKYVCGVESDWNVHPEWWSPQGFKYESFAGYPLLQQTLIEVRIEAARFYTPAKGMPWISLPARGGPFTPHTAVLALVNLLNDKCGKYATLKQGKALAALYLVAYYAEAFRRNTPYVPLTLAQVAERARIAANLCLGPFNGVFLFDLVAQTEQVVQMWP